MAVVVEQTIPFPSDSLDLDDQSRWNQLFPLIRPSVRSFQTPKGHTILIDTNLIGRGEIDSLHVVAVTNPGNFSSKILDDRNVTAIVTDQRGGGLLTTDDIVHTVESAVTGTTQKPRVLVIRLGAKREMSTPSRDIIEVEVRTESELDQVLMLISRSTPSCRASHLQVSQLVKAYLDTARTVCLKFHTEKSQDKPAVLLANGITTFTKAQDIIFHQLNEAIRPADAQDSPSVHSVHVSDINGLSRLENYLIVGEIGKYLDGQNIAYSLSHSSVLDHKHPARGLHITVAAIPQQLLPAQPKPSSHSIPAIAEHSPSSRITNPTNTRTTFDDSSIRRRIEVGCNAVIEAEPTITEYDTIVGDGDCGYTLRDGAKQVLSFIANRDLTHLDEALSDLVDDLEVNMGGTSGALYCIFLTALAGALARETSFPKALHSALDQLMQYTRARLGDRTMMDALIPFVNALVETGNVEKAMDKAKEGVEGTKKMEAKLGRSSYLDESATQGVPDPGAYGLLVLLSGMALSGDDVEMKRTR